jgi:hypothetical protein
MAKKTAADRSAVTRQPEYWTHLRHSAVEVARWPAWKRGEIPERQEEERRNERRVVERRTVIR